MHTGPTGLTQRTAMQPLVRMSVAALLAWLLFRFWCAFPAANEEQLLLMVILAGAGGSLAGQLGAKVRAMALIPRAASGMLSALLFYCCLRGPIIHPTALEEFRASALLSLGTLTGILRPGPLGSSRAANLIAARVTAVLLASCGIRGVACLVHLYGSR